MRRLLRKLILWILDDVTGVASFNTRTGAVKLLASDIVPLANPLYVHKAGDMMTGSLFVDGAGVVTTANDGAFICPRGGKVQDDHLGNLVFRPSYGNVVAQVTPHGVEIEGLTSETAGQSPLKIRQPWQGQVAHDGISFEVTDFGGAVQGTSLLKLRNVTAGVGFSVWGDVAGGAELTGVLVTTDTGDARSGLVVESSGFAVHVVRTETLGFFGRFSQGQQGAPGNTLEEVLSALRAYGLLS